MKRKNVHAYRQQLCQEYPDVIAALSMRLVSCKFDRRRLNCYFIADRDVTKIVGELFLYGVADIELQQHIWFEDET